ncbi:hypothetical protein HQ520_11375, partial [bacterium]|nr:hypothetical protein [bacterium]
AYGRGEDLELRGTADVTAILQALAGIDYAANERLAIVLGGDFGNVGDPLPEDGADIWRGWGSREWVIDPEKDQDPEKDDNDYPAYYAYISEFSEGKNITMAGVDFSNLRVRLEPAVSAAHFDHEKHAPMPDLGYDPEA